MGVSVPSPYITSGAFQTQLPGGRTDNVIAKLSSDGSRVIWASYLGGSGNDLVPSIRVDADGYVYVDGSTTSADFPTTEGAFQTQYAGGLTGNWEQTGDRFIAKISPDGRHLLASTFMGGNQRDGGEGITVDDQGRVYLSSFTYSDDFPVNDAAMQREKAVGSDGVAFILRYSGWSAWHELLQ